MFVCKDIYTDGHLTLLNSEVSFDFKNVQLTWQWSIWDTFSHSSMCNQIKDRSIVWSSRIFVSGLAWNNQVFYFSVLLYKDYNTHLWSNMLVLIWAAIELFFFPETCMVLCFEFVMKRVLITQGWFSCCWVAVTQSQELHPISEQAGSAQVVGKGHSWDNQGQMAKGCCSSSHNIWCHTQHVISGKEEVKGDIWSDDICLFKSPQHMVDPWFPGGGWTPVCL